MEHTCPTNGCTLTQAHELSRIHYKTERRKMVRTDSRPNGNCGRVPLDEALLMRLCARPTDHGDRRRFTKWTGSGTPPSIFGVLGARITQRKEDWAGRFTTACRNPFKIVRPLHVPSKMVTTKKNTKQNCGKVTLWHDR